MEATYSAERLERVHQRALEEARTRPPKGEMRGGDGVLTRRIPRVAFFNAVVNHGVDPRDDGYWDDMERRHPEIGVKFEGKPGVRGGGVAIEVGAGRLTRFGRVTFHKRYGDG